MCQTVIFVSYWAEMVDTDGKLRIEYVKDVSNVLKLKVPSLLARLIDAFYGTSPILLEFPV